MDLFWQDDAGQIRTIEFDATLREEHLGSASPTRYPIEGNASAVDHAVIEPVTKIYEVFVSDSPAHVPATHMFGVRGSVESVRVSTHSPRIARGATARSEAEIESDEGSVAARVLSFDGPVARRERVLAELERLRVNRQLVSVAGAIDALDDMLITKVGAPLETRDGEGVTFRLELQQITYGEAQVIQVPDPEQPRGRASVDMGAVSTTEATPDLESNWHRLSRSAGWL